MMATVHGRTDFEQLFDRAWSRCRHLAVRIVRDDAVAEELAAEAFARAWARWPWLSRTDSPEGWLMRVTTNLAIDAVRRRRVTAVEPEEVRAMDEVATLHVALMAALRSLPKRQRQAIVLRYLAGMSEAEVSAALGVSAGSVKTHVHRGIAALGRSLGPDRDVEVALRHGS
jgi:RNA polymerase sigma-70 factor (sigma-E family)